KPMPLVSSLSLVILPFARRSGGVTRRLLGGLVAFGRLAFGLRFGRRRRFRGCFRFFQTLQAWPGRNDLSFCSFGASSGRRPAEAGDVGANQDSLVLLQATFPRRHRSGPRTLVDNRHDVFDRTDVFVVIVG